MFLDIPYITFFTAERADLFWQNTRVVLYVAMPLLLIYMAVEFGGEFIRTIRNAFRKPDHDEYQEREKDYDR